MNRETHLRVLDPAENEQQGGDRLLIGEKYLQTVLEISRQQLLREMDSRLTQVRPRRLAINSQGETEYLEADRIVRMEASGCYTLCYLSDGRKLTVSRTLGEFERVLAGQHFVRVHHSHLVNLHYIRKYHKKDGYGVRMADGDLVPVAVRRKDEFELRMKALVL